MCIMPLVVRLLVPLLVLAGCSQPQTYSEAVLDLRGSVGKLKDIDGTGTFEVWTDHDLDMAYYMGDVPVGDSSVYVEVTLWNSEAMPVGEAMRFSPGALDQDGVFVEVYVCPEDEFGDGEASGDADDVLSTRFKDGSLTIGATAADPARNLDVAIRMERPAPARPLD